MPREIDATRRAALAARLDASPRELLALAARLAPRQRIDRADVDAELARIRAAGESADAGVDILLLGFANFAADDIDRALEIVWRGSDVELR
jgi:DNA-binding IclR family transcriptional regulator